MCCDAPLACRDIKPATVGGGEAAHSEGNGPNVQTRRMHPARDREFAVDRPRLQADELIRRVLDSVDVGGGSSRVPARPGWTRLRAGRTRGSAYPVPPRERVYRGLKAPLLARWSVRGSRAPTSSKRFDVPDGVSVVNKVCGPDLTRAMGQVSVEHTVHAVMFALGLCNTMLNITGTL
jgi:hypothetical protein